MKKLILLAASTLLVSASAMAQVAQVKPYDGQSQMKHVDSKYQTGNGYYAQSGHYLVDVHQYGDQPKSREQVHQELIQYQKWPWNKDLYQGA